VSFGPICNSAARANTRSNAERSSLGPGRFDLGEGGDGSDILENYSDFWFFGNSETVVAGL
jgi:hypothetical protein